MAMEANLTNANAMGTPPTASPQRPLRPKPDSTPSPGSNSESTPMAMTTIAAAETHRRQNLASDR